MPIASGTQGDVVGNRNLYGNVYVVFSYKAVCTGHHKTFDVSVKADV